MPKLSDIEKELAKSAQAKMEAGAVCTPQERRAYAKAERCWEEQQHQALMLDIPRRYYNWLSGRQNNTLQQQADRYGLPLRGERLNLQAIITGFHDFLRDNAHRLAAEPGGIDPDLIGKNSPALERYRDEKAKMITLQRKEMERHLSPREDVRNGFGVLAQRLRQLGEVYQRKNYTDAAKLLNEALDDMERTLAKHFGNEAEAADEELRV
jgi:hypothetical protein